MSGVVLRCSNCGTVQSDVGECEACHAAQVRFFCTNHTSGLWLDASACQQCGARFGEARSEPLTPRSAVERTTPSFSPPGAERTTAKPEIGTHGHEDVPPRMPEEVGYARSRVPTAGTLLEALAYAARARSMRKAAADDSSYEPVRASGGGCVRRLLLLSLLVMAIFLLAPLLLGGALVRLL